MECSIGNHNESGLCFWRLDPDFFSFLKVGSGSGFFSRRSDPGKIHPDPEPQGLQVESMREGCHICLSIFNELDVETGSPGPNQYPHNLYINDTFVSGFLLFINSYRENQKQSVIM